MFTLPPTLSRPPHGGMKFHKGNYEAAFRHLRRSVELDDDLPYDEPWGWMHRARRCPDPGIVILANLRVKIWN